MSKISDTAGTPAGAGEGTYRKCRGLERMSQHGRKNQERAICRKLPSGAGIYILWFEGQRRAYIGQSNNIAYRVRTHLYDIETFPNHKMRADLDICGWEWLRAAVLESAETCDGLHARETYWMNQYRNGGWELYNHDSVGKVHRDRARSR